VSCNNRAQINRCPGKWVRLADPVNPPNATQSERDLVVRSAAIAADEAAESHCRLARCEDAACLAKPEPGATRTYDFEERQTGQGFSLRALCTMSYECACGEKDEDEGGKKPRKPPSKKKR
jgi:hypothetical protein